MRRAAARRQREAEVRARGREWAKRWRVEHPERRREYQQRWVAENREKVREYYNRYYEAHRDEVNARAAARRDADPERTKQITRHWAERNKERRADLQRSRRSDPEMYQSELEANADARRLKRSRSRAGLPPNRIHVATAAERRATDRDADAYFNGPSRPEQLRQSTAFTEALTEHMLKNGARLRDVAAAVRSTKAEVHREERQQQLDEPMKAIVVHCHQDRWRLNAKAEMENRARAHRGDAAGAGRVVGGTASAAGRHRARAHEQVDQSGCLDRRPHRGPERRNLAQISRRGRPIGSSTGAPVVDGDERSEQNRPLPTAGAGLGGTHARRWIELVRHLCALDSQDRPLMRYPSRSRRSPGRKQTHNHGYAR